MSLITNFNIFLKSITIYYLFVVIVPATNNVWKNIMSFLGGSMTASAIHTFVFKGRNGIKDKLGFPKSEKHSVGLYDLSKRTISDTGQ